MASTWLPGATAAEPNVVAGHKSVHLTAISVISEDDVWVVGSHLKENLTKPFAEHWDGETWTIADLPKVNIRGNSSLSAVDAIAPDDVWVVGTRPKGWRPRPLVMHFDGTSWDTRDPRFFHSLPGGLTGVADAGPSDVWMVGSLNDGRTLTAHWDGEQLRGSDMQGPQFSSLDGVCLPGPGRALAVGRTAKGGGEQPLAEEWDGARWRVEQAPDPGEPLSAFQAVTCSADTDDAWAVGRANTFTRHRGLVAHRTADGWTLVPDAMQFNAQLAGVVEAAPDDVWAVGYRRGRGKTLVPWVQHGSDGGWVGGSVPSIPGARLTCVDADTPDDVWVAGDDGDGGNVVDRWNGSTWVRVL